MTETLVSLLQQWAAQAPDECNTRHQIYDVEAESGSLPALYVADKSGDGENEGWGWHLVFDGKEFYPDTDEAQMRILWAVMRAVAARKMYFELRYIQPADRYFAEVANRHYTTDNPAEALLSAYLLVVEAEEEARPK